MKPDLIVGFGSIRETYISLADNAAASAALRSLGISSALISAVRLAKYVESAFAAIETVLKEAAGGRSKKRFVSH